MYQITSLTKSNTQKFTVNISDVASVEIELQYFATQESWFISMTSGDFAIKNQRLCISKNFLDKYKNIINFGLMVKSLDGGEPLFQNDFTYPRIQLFILTDEEKEEIHDLWYRKYIND